MVSYDWYDALKDSNERGKGFHVDKPIKLSFYFVNKFDHSYGLVNLKEAYDRDRENHSDRYIESSDIAELQSGVQVEVPHGHNQDIETMSQSMSDSHLYADTAETPATSPWRRCFGSSNTAESFDPRRAPLSSASLRYAPQVPRPSTLTLRSPVDVSGQHELPYNPSSEIHEVPGDYERVTDSQGGGYFDPDQNPFEQ
ncbi:uncharacterized protein L199_001590 [Kwoniella botswanensis]|uniref:uncharacterized protein n=1 Tax=Kwoniella botswanensis TaxID=1268659 RepID=UPI00315D3F89